MVEEKLSDLLYKVQCGAVGKRQVIHCDHMRSEASEKEGLPGIKEEIDLLEEVAHCDLSKGFDRPSRQQCTQAWQSNFDLD